MELEVRILCNRLEFVGKYDQYFHVGKAQNQAAEEAMTRTHTPWHTHKAGAQVAAQLFPVFLLESSAFGSAIGAESLAAAVSDYGT